MYFNNEKQKWQKQQKNKWYIDTLPEGRQNE